MKELLKKILNVVLPVLGLMFVALLVVLNIYVTMQYLVPVSGLLLGVLWITFVFLVLIAAFLEIYLHNA